MGAFASPFACAAAWDAPESDVPQPFSAPGGVAAATVASALAPAPAAGSATAVVRLSALTPGATYAFRLSATDADGARSYGTVMLVVNAPPSSGTVAVAPPSGMALATSFTFAALNWVRARVHRA